MRRCPLRHPGIASGILVLLILQAGADAAWSQVRVSAAGAVESSPTLEAVRTAYASGRSKEALLLADRAISGIAETASGEGELAELHFWRGASLRRLDRPEEAIVALDTSSRLGLRIPELYLERALSHRSLKQETEAERDYQEAERLLPPDDGRKLRFAERWGGASKADPAFALSITPQMGYDSNLFGLEKDAPLIDPDAQQKSLYYGLVFGAKAFLHRSDTQTLALEYRNQLRAFTEDSELDYTDNLLSVVARQPFLEGADLEVRGMLGEASSDGEGHLRTTRTVAPAFLLHFSSAVQARLWGDWTDVDYYVDDIPAEQDRDGGILRAGLILGIDLGAGWSVAPHLGVASYEADGDDYDHRDAVAGIALTTPEFLGCVLSPSVSYTRAEYANPDSVTGFTEERSDRILRLGLAVVVRELERQIGYAPALALSFLDHGSNLEPYDYRRWEPRIEMTILAMSF